MPTTRVNGKAAPGDKVTYHDIANQDDKIWEVVSTPDENKDPKYGWSKGYLLMADDGTTSWSDLAQHGWTFAQDHAK